MHDVFRGELLLSCRAYDFLKNDNYCVPRIPVMMFLKNYVTTKVYGVLKRGFFIRVYYEASSASLRLTIDSVEW